MKATTAVSIDSGGCSIASINPTGIPTLVANNCGNTFVTPLEVAFGGERVEIGQAARRYLEDDPSIGWAENVFSLLGTDTQFHGAGLRNPNELLDCVVRKLQIDVERSWLGPLQSLIVAVSADLNHLQRNSLIRSFRNAGVDNIRLVDSSIAASFYIQPTPCNKPLLICEIQNDRVQASLIQVNRAERTMLAVHQLRIDDQDSLYQVVAEDIKKTVQSSSPAKVDSNIFDRCVLVTARSMVESILNSGDRTLQSRKVLLGSTVELTLTADKVGTIGERYFEKAGACLSECLDDADMKWSDIEAVCFVGEFSGLTEFVQNYACFASIPMAVRTVNKARWAAVYGAAILGHQESNAIRIKTHPLVLNHLGLRVRSTKLTGLTRLSLITNRRQLPTKISHIFKTSRIDQERLVLEIDEGSDSNYRVVKVVEFGPLFPRSENHPIEVRFHRDEQGLLKVTAFDGITREPIHSYLANSSVGARAN